ncbi:MAG: ATP synthase F1 subunit epsilon [Candidatus Zixiibacteriota bacterium]
MFRLSIVTPEKVLFDGEVKSLFVPGSEGYLGVLSHHAPLITALKPGKVEYREKSDHTAVLALGGGFMEVSGNKATILAEDVEFADKIDLSAAEAEYNQQRARLAAHSKGDTSIDVKAARAAMERAANRISIAKESR